MAQPHWLLCRAGVVMLVATLSALGSGMDIVLHDVGATPFSLEALTALEEAASVWERAWYDPITVEINVKWDDPASFDRPDTLAATLAAYTTHDYADTLATMTIRSDSLGERHALERLPAGGLHIRDINGTRLATFVTMTTANAKALTLGTALDPVYGDELPDHVDARIRFNSSFASQFDYDPSDEIDGSQYDFVGVAAHEIGHALGYLSLTDIQDANPGATLSPTTWDLWRFAQAEDDHDVVAENRQLTAGPAEYYVSSSRQRNLSYGMREDDPWCGLGESLDPSTIVWNCQASHWQDVWRDDPLMGPIFHVGEAQVKIKGIDLEAMDYMGYTPKWLLVYLPRSAIAGLYEPRPIEPPPDFGGMFDDFAPLPDASKIQPPFPYNLAMRVGLDVDLPNLQKRSGLGFVNWVPATENPDPTVLKAPVAHELISGAVEDLFPKRDPMKTIPATITDFYFVSDETAGKPFVFSDAFSVHGAQFDETLGDYGGFRIPGFVDGLADDVIGDIDAIMTVLLLLTEPAPPDPTKIQQVLLRMHVGSAENVLRIFDGEALGVPLPLRAGDANQDYSFDQLDLVQVQVVAKYLTDQAATWGEGDWDGAPGGEPGNPPIGNGRFDQLDIIAALEAGIYLTGPYNAELAEVPEPSAITLLATSLAVLCACRYAKFGGKIARCTQAHRTKE